MSPAPDQVEPAAFWCSAEAPTQSYRQAAYSEHRHAWPLAAEPGLGLCRWSELAGSGTGMPSVAIFQGRRRDVQIPSCRLWGPQRSPLPSPVRGVGICCPLFLWDPGAGHARRQPANTWQGRLADAARLEPAWERAGGRSELEGGSQESGPVS